MKTAVLRPETLSDDALLARLHELVGRGRRVEAELVWHLAEVDARRLYRREACPSMHVYATSRLHLSDAEAYLRITVARVSRRFPVVLAMLADGRLHLSAIAKLSPHLRDDGGEALLARAAHRSKREIELLVAEVAPRPDAPSVMRRLPAARGQGTALALLAGSVAPTRPTAAEGAQLRPDGAISPDHGNQAAPIADSAAPGTGAARAAPGTGAGSAAPGTGAGSAAPGGARAAHGVAAPAASRSGSVAPLAVVAESAEPTRPTVRYKVQFTAGAELHDKIARAQALLRHQIPDGDLAAVMDRAVTLLVRELERARFGATESPRKSASEVDPRPSSRRIPAPIRRAVWKRDGGQCTFRDRQGRRCLARERLEFHHRVPFARGGDHSEGNVALRCRVHNAYQADLDFGAAFMAARRGPALGRAAPDASRALRTCPG